MKDFIPNTENVLQVCEAIAIAEEQKLKDNAGDILHWLTICDRATSMKLETAIASRFDAFREKVINILSKTEYEKEDLALLNAVLWVFLFNLDKIDISEFENQLDVLRSDNSPISKDEISSVRWIITDIFRTNKERNLYLQLLQDFGKNYTLEQIFDKYTVSVENCKNFKGFIVMYKDKKRYPDQYVSIDIFHFSIEDIEKLFDICSYIVEKRKEMAKDIIPIGKCDLDACEQILRADEQDLIDNADEILSWLDVGTSDLLPRLIQAIVERFSAFKIGIKKILSKRLPMTIEERELIESAIDVLYFALRKIDIIEFKEDLSYFASADFTTDEWDKENIDLLYNMDELIKLNEVILGGLANGYTFEQIKVKFQDRIDIEMCSMALENSQSEIKFPIYNWLELFFTENEQKILLDLFEYLIKSIL